jgi:hypothetical protein
VVDYYQSYGALPSSNADAGLPPPASYATYCDLESVTVSAGGVITTNVLATPNYPAGSIVLKLIDPNTGAWGCTTTIAEAAYQCTYAGLPARMAMTWGVFSNDAALGTTYQSCWGRPPAATAHGGCDPYRGDTSTTLALPVSCVLRNGVAPPVGIITPGYYNQWLGGSTQHSSPLEGTRMASRGTGDAHCTREFGLGWRMAEFHMGRGWGFHAFGATPNSSRFWVAINDQNANPWGYGNGPEYEEPRAPGGGGVIVDCTRNPQDCI